MVQLCFLGNACVPYISQHIDVQCTASFSVAELPVGRCCSFKHFGLHGLLKFTYWGSTGTC
jgi:hypothetical protein